MKQKPLIDFVKVTDFSPPTYILLKGQSAERAIKEFKRKQDLKLKTQSRIR